MFQVPQDEYVTYVGPFEAFVDGPMYPPEKLVWHSKEPIPNPPKASS